MAAKKKTKRAKAKPGPQTGFVVGDLNSTNISLSGGDVHKTLKSATECCFGYGDSDQVIFEVTIVAVHRRPETPELVREELPASIKFVA